MCLSFVDEFENPEASGEGYVVLQESETDANYLSVFGDEPYDLDKEYQAETIIGRFQTSGEYQVGFHIFDEYNDALRFMQWIRFQCILNSYVVAKVKWKHQFARGKQNIKLHTEECCSNVVVSKFRTIIEIVHAGCEDAGTL